MEVSQNTNVSGRSYNYNRKIISKHPPLFPLAMNPVKHDFSKTESALVDVSSLTAKRRLERRLGKI